VAVDPPAILLTCEHGGNAVPARWARLFRGQRGVLATHRGWDIGALEAAREFRRRWGVPLVQAHVTRLLVDLNRSPGHRHQFSEFTRDLPDAEKARILAAHYEPYREAVRRRVRGALAGNRRLVQVSVHSFTPVLHEVVRNADIGFLYDPRRAFERRFCHAWEANLRAAEPGLRIRRNYPYRGTSDGLVTALRREFPAARYAGMEIEINHAWALGDPRAWRALLRVLADTVPRPALRRAR
jgi:predicted N-formylglutamate amidohydrolase